MSLMRILDSCTGTDICRGKKDIAKVAAFVKNARQDVQENQ
jgi:phosphoribosylanthranilate isomerase